MSASMKQYQDIQKEYKIKPHSALTVLAVCAAVGPFSLLRSITYENPYAQTFLVVFKTIMAVLFVAFFVAAFYHYRVFFNLRKEGINADRNLFFAESASSFRKIAFYISFALDSIRSVQSYIHPEDITQRMKRLKYQLRSEYYHDVDIAILESAVLSILFVEVMRIVFPSTFGWSDKKHWTIVISATFIISAFKVFVLKMSSGHGVF